MANIMQIANFSMNVKETSNDEIMKELLKQDKILDYQNNLLQEQTNEYLKYIIEQNNSILELLEQKGE